MLFGGAVKRLVEELPGVGIRTRAESLGDGTIADHHTAIYTTKEGRKLMATLWSYNDSRSDYSSLSATIRDYGDSPGSFFTDAQHMDFSHHRSVTVSRTTQRGITNTKQDSSGPMLRTIIGHVPMKLPADVRLRLLEEFHGAEFDEAETRQVQERVMASERDYDTQGGRTTRTVVEWPLDSSGSATIDYPIPPYKELLAEGPHVIL